jgi:hypothetical protein
MRALEISSLASKSWYFLKVLVCDERFALFRKCATLLMGALELVSI